MAARRRRAAIVIAVVVLLVMAFIALIFQSKILAGFGGVTLVLVILLRLLPELADRETSRLLKAERRALRGARGEEAVASILSVLGQDYFTLHDLESPYGNIDHVVIARNGSVYLLETKAHHGRVELVNSAVLLNGKPPEKDFVAQALRNASWLSERISALVGGKIWVTPIIVFANAFVPRLPPIKGVRIINKRFLNAAISALNKGPSQGHPAWEYRTEIAQSLQMPTARVHGTNRPRVGRA
jgi:hypothetical protein